MRLAIKPMLLALSLCMATSPLATADVSQGELIGQRTVSRARRAVAIGPTAGGTLVLGKRDVDGAISMGLGLYLFDVAVVPSLATMSEALQGSAKREALARAKHMIASGEAPPGVSTDDLADAIFEEVRAELQRQLLAEGKKFEKPRLTLDLEAGYQVTAEAWNFRTTATIGLGPVSLGPTLHVSRAGVALGPELALRLLGNRGRRPPVLGLFARADFAMHNRADMADVFGIGVRALLDLL